ncbi:fucose 4-O-acetylase [Leuconostoc koreense]|nr:fucose 4-O-acetylase [Leuconostoc mesenteroides]QGM26052.1 fucose 4-O-acetylase [Leuconostoc mesenteroides subsp. mesenteroides]
MTKKYLNAFLMVIIALIGVVYLTRVAGDLHAFHGLGKLVSYFSWPLLLVGFSQLTLLENRKPGDIFDCYLLVSTILAVIGFLITLQIITVRAPFQFAMGNWWDAITAGALGNEENLHTPLGEVWTKYPIGWFLMMTPITMKLAHYVHQKIADKRLLIIIAIALMIVSQYIGKIIDLPFSLNAALLGTGLLLINDSIIVKSTKMRIIWIVIGSMVTIIAAKMSGVYFSYGRAENIFISVFGLIAAIKLIEFLLDFVTIHVKWNMSKKIFFYTTVGFLFILTLVVNLTIFLN